MPLNLGELEQALRGLSHSEEAIRTVQTFSEDLNGTQARIDTWNATNALVRTVIDQSEAATRGFNTPDDEFFILQGDIVRTESAFLYGERITGTAKFIVLNSSCDLVPGRSQHAALLRIIPIRRGDDRVKDKLGILLKFRRRDSMYLPPLPGDDEDVLGNVIEFQGICQIEGTNLQLAERVASLSLLGWRIFASLARAVVARSNPREVEIREAMEK
jgi:hypothetical protein